MASAEIVLRFDRKTQQQLDRLEELLLDVRTGIRRIIQEGEAIVADLTQLQNDVQANSDATASAVTLLNGLAEALRAAATDPAAVQALATQIEQNTQALADAVVANTPAQ